MTLRNTASQSCSLCPNHSPKRGYCCTAHVWANAEVGQSVHLGTHLLNSEPFWAFRMPPTARWPVKILNVHVCSGLSVEPVTAQSKGPRWWQRSGKPEHRFSSSFHWCWWGQQWCAVASDKWVRTRRDRAGRPTPHDPPVQSHLCLAHKSSRQSSAVRPLVLSLLLWIRCLSDLANGDGCRI